MNNNNIIKITDQELEKKMKEMLEGKLTRADLIKEWKTDRITLNNRIQEVYVKNPELYFEFIRKFPYKPREYTHIDYEAMLIDIMKKGYTKKEAAEQYGIHDRTIARKVHKVEEKNPELVELYRQVAYYRKHKYKLPEELQIIVNDLEEKEVFIGGIYDKKEEKLLQKEREYNKTRLERISDSKAYGNTRTKKLLSTLYRLEIEQNVRKANKTGDFKAGYKVDTRLLQKVNIENNEDNIDINKEKNEKGIGVDD